MMKRRLLAWALASLLANPGPARAQEAATGPDDLLLAVVVDATPISEGMAALQSEGHVLLPLGELARHLTLAIETDPARGVASGFLLDTNRTFALDVGRATVVIGGKAEAVDPSMIVVRPDDIYVSSTLLARWLPVDLGIDLSRLAVDVKPRERLPLQFRLEREAAGRTLSGRGPVEDAEYPRRGIPYAPIRAPSIDQTLGLEFHGGKGRSDLDVRYSAYATADLLGLQSALYVNAGDMVDGPNVRLTLGRQDPEGNLLGVLRARTALVGNVPLPAVPYVARSSAVGDGWVVSNRPLSRPDSFGTHTLQGPLQPGWDVELYFNEVLVGFQSAGPDGQYRFENLPLLFGPNEFRLVFHGPLGEVRVERESFLLEDSIARKGELHYHVAQHRDDEGEIRSHLQIDWGVSDRLGATAGVVSIPVDGAIRRYANLGARGNWRSMMVSAGMVRAQDGGSLAEIGVRTRAGGWTLGFDHVRLDGFSSEIFTLGSDAIRSSTGVRIDGQWRWPGSSMRLPVMLDARSDERESGARDDDITARIAANLRGTALTSQLRWRSLGGQTVADTTWQVSRRWSGGSIRGQLNYRLLPERAPDAVSLAIDRNRGAGYVQSFTVTRFFDSSSTLYSLGLNKAFGRFGLGIHSGYTSDGEVTAGLQLFLAARREPYRGRWEFGAVPTAASGAASARVFLDRDRDGRMGPGDTPVEGVSFEVDGGRWPVKTDAGGIAHLDRLQVARPTAIRLVAGSLEDPQWKPQVEGVRIVARPGATALLDFPVISTVEIEGTVRVSTASGVRPAGGLRIVAIDGSGSVVSTAVTAADGYYVLTGVPTGSVTIRLAAEQLERRGFREVDARAVAVPVDEWLVAGIDFELQARD